MRFRRFVLALDGPAHWRALALVTLLVIELLVLMEWIFFVTKPSFLSAMDGPHQLLVLGLAPLPLLLPAGLLLGILWLTSTVIKIENWRLVLGFVATLVPTAILGALYLLLIDNFTNTMWGLAIQKSAGPVRVLVSLGVLALLVLAYRSVCNLQRAVGKKLGVWTIVGAVPLLIAMALLIKVEGHSIPADPLDIDGAELALAKRPNILILGSDGLNADHLSCYGYGRDTTPFLKSLLPGSLVGENSFSNCSHTTGSLASILTGRLPTENGVTYPPDILTGRDVYRHLPGLLKKAGYRTAQISIRHYGDAYDVNLRDGFDVANFRRRETAQVASSLNRYLGMETSLFAEQVYDRISVRVAHTAGANVLSSAYQEAVHGDRLVELPEERRFQGLLKILRDEPEPFFVHAHFMGTHGPRFNLMEQVFSAGSEQDSSWMLDFYDDAIREFDHATRLLMTVLHARGAMDNTIVIIYSDHGLNSDSRHRTPLILRFPDAEHAGRLTSNVQCLDIAPTVLDYLGLEVPAWMSGRSLLAAAPNPLRPVYSTRFRDDVLTRVVPGGPLMVDARAAGPPFYSMGSLVMIVGQRVYTLDLVAQDLEVHDLADHTAALAESDLPSPEAAEIMMVAHLVQRGFDVSGLRLPLLRKRLP